MIQSVYFHIPFCTHICHYCDFNKVFLANQPVEDYLQAMEREMQFTTEKFGERQMNTLFVGGGTPTALNVVQLHTLLTSIHRHFSFEKAEFTFEANPDGLTKEKLHVLRDAGVNRLSLGVQTFDENLLKAIGRTHRYEDVMNTIEMARAVGFENISCDFMYGLPKQTMEQVKQTLEIAFSLPVTHFSAYSLIVEPKTVFYLADKKGKLPLPTQDEEALMYEFVMEQMEKNNFRQYEISNFARPNKESRHNLTYWNNEYYYGIGAGAHSYVNGVRRSNVNPLKKYMENPCVYIEENTVTKAEEMEEQLFLGLRKMAGVNREVFYERFGIEMERIFKQAIKEQIENGLLEWREDNLRLTHRGKLLGNEVFAAFLGIQEIYLDNTDHI